MYRVRLITTQLSSASELDTKETEGYMESLPEVFRPFSIYAFCDPSVDLSFNTSIKLVVSSIPARVFEVEKGCFDITTTSGSRYMIQVLQDVG